MVETDLGRLSGRDDFEPRSARLQPHVLNHLILGLAGPCREQMPQSSVRLGQSPWQGQPYGLEQGTCQVGELIMVTAGVSTVQGALWEQVIFGRFVWVFFPFFF